MTRDGLRAIGESRDPALNRHEMHIANRSSKDKPKSATRLPGKPKPERNLKVKSKRK